MNEILWHNRARKQIKLIPTKEREMIFDRIDLLVDFPAVDGVDVKPLTGHQYGYRLRVGRYRILFDYNNDIQVISIQEVKKRDERTY
jgi:mRNA-degrading endonuclease RelE of RelBE toxin-antitoxin system